MTSHYKSHPDHAWLRDLNPVIVDTQKSAVEEAIETLTAHKSDLEWTLSLIKEELAEVRWIDSADDAPDYSLDIAHLSGAFDEAQDAVYSIQDAIDLLQKVSAR